MGCVRIGLLILIPLAVLGLYLASAVFGLLDTRTFVRVSVILGAVFVFALVIPPLRHLFYRAFRGPDAGARGASDDVPRHYPSSFKWDMVSVGIIVACSVVLMILFYISGGPVAQGIAMLATIAFIVSVLAGALRTLVMLPQWYSEARSGDRELVDVP